MRPEVGDALPDLFALGLHPIHGRQPVRFDNGARHEWFDTNALRKRHRFFDERIKISFPIDHCDFPRRQPIGTSPALSLLGGVNTVDNWRRDGRRYGAAAIETNCIKSQQIDLLHLDRVCIYAGG
jgi:hypothetical protein